MHVWPAVGSFSTFLLELRFEVNETSEVDFYQNDIRPAILTRAKWHRRKRLQEVSDHNYGLSTRSTSLYLYRSTFWPSMSFEILLLLYSTAHLQHYERPTSFLSTASRPACAPSNVPQLAQVVRGDVILHICCCPIHPNTPQQFSVDLSE
jgi:hypothetical protein